MENKKEEDESMGSREYKTDLSDSTEQERTNQLNSKQKKADKKENRKKSSIKRLFSSRLPSLNRNKKNTKWLIGIQRFDRYGIKTYQRGTLVYFRVQPSNLAVLSYENVNYKIHQMTLVFSGIPDLEVLCLDSRERFERNKAYLKKRIQKESNTKIRSMLCADYEFLDQIQMEMATAREFIFLLRFHSETPEQIFATVNRVEKIIREQNFEIMRMEQEAIKRTLAIYFDSDNLKDYFEDIEGESLYDPEIKTLLNQQT
ncbi:hypothetical protein [Diplocloster hominis]|uniref:hypothetical protein n=1 Tax=Diplocloster hominis TaxID=3079010 RepID=UPI0031B9F1C9